MTPIFRAGLTVFSVLLFLMAARPDAHSGPEAFVPPALLPEEAGSLPGVEIKRLYAYVTGSNVPVYSRPFARLDGVRPKRFLGEGFVWVSLEDRHPGVNGTQEWYRINPGEFVSASNLKLFEPSTFHGVSISMSRQAPFAWLILNTDISSAPGAAAEFDAPSRPRYSIVRITGFRRYGRWGWYRIGPDEWVEQRRLAVVKPVPRPAVVGPDEKWIDINLYEQTLTAYEGDAMVYATLISSGVDRFPTEKGLFRVWAKSKMSKMSGGVPGDDYYFLEDVPWQIYFYRGFAIHAAYWHDNFGFRQSHGCVNVAPADAKWLFEWTEPAAARSNWTFSGPARQGTWVWVHG